MFARLYALICLDTTVFLHAYVLTCLLATPCSPTLTHIDNRLGTASGLFGSTLGLFGSTLGLFGSALGLSVSYTHLTLPTTVSV